MTFPYRLIGICLVCMMLSGCGGVPLFGSSSVPTPTAGTNVEATVAASIAATIAADQGQLRTQPPVSPTPFATPGAAARAVENGRFVIDQRSRSDRNALENVALVLHNAEVTGDTLTLRIAFENISDESFYVTGGGVLRQAVLRDASGNEYEPIEVSDNLRTISPQGGFTAGAANVGNVRFPRPPGNAPYELIVPEYDPIIFRLNTPLADEPFELAEGTYPISQSLRSNRDALVPVELQVRSLEVGSERLVFEIAFVNTGRQGYDLLVGPDGGDARLLDAERVQYEPISIDPVFESGIAPDGGWGPGQANVGVIAFPRPEAIEELRFIFPEYDALTIRLAAGEIAEAVVTSPSGGAPQPTATPAATDVAFAELTDLLAQQARALLEGNAAGYLGSFAPELHAAQRQILTRVAQVPLEDYRLELAPDASISEFALQSGTLDRLPVRVLYTLRGINPDNVFTHDLRYSFTRSGGAWQVSAFEIDENPPFWYTGDVLVRETDHFLIFARPELAGELAALEQETAVAYETLAGYGLPLEPRYVAYFTASQDDFSELTGRLSGRVLGIALSRYAFDSDEVVVSSYAFYLNGEAFADERNDLSGADRQTTITHELVHLVLAPVTRPYTPPWLVEGAAVYYSEGVGGEKRERLLNDGRLDGITLTDLTRAGTLGEHDFLGQQVGYEYIFSGEAFAYLSETFGEDVTLEFYRSYAAVPAANVRDEMPRFGSPFAANAVFANLRETLTEDAVQRFFNRSLEQLDADVKAWLKQTQSG